jgi:hypothetical protein
MRSLTILLLILAVISALAPLLIDLPQELGIGLNVLALFSGIGAYLTFKDEKKDKEEVKDVDEDFKERIDRWKDVMKIDEKLIASEIKNHETTRRVRALSMPVKFTGKSEYDKFLSEQEEFETAESIYERFCEWCWKKLKRLKIKTACPNQFKKNFNEQIKVGSIKTNANKIWATVVLTPVLFAIPLLPIMILLPIFYKVVSLGIIAVSAYVAYAFPSWVSTQTKMKVQTDMLYAMLYISLYLRLNPNMEGAVVFTSQKIGGPFGADMRKAVWDLHVKNYPNIMASIGQFQEKWAVWNDSFIKSMSVLNSSMREVSIELRNRELARALDLLIEGTHAKMGKFAEQLSVQVKLFRGLLLLPILLSLVLPMVSVFMSINPGYLITFFNIILPVVNFTIGMKILAERPGTFKIDVSKRTDAPPSGTFKILGYQLPVLPFAILVLFLISLPGWLHLAKLYPILIGQQVDPEILNSEYTIENMALSWLITLGLGVGVFIYWYGGNVQRIPLRDEVKGIETHFQSTIRELGIALRENIPIETALRMILDEYRRFKLQESPMFRFLEQTVNTMSSTGLSFKSALFDPHLGVMKEFPSDLVKNVMLILTESINKGPEQAALVCETISQYLLKVDELNKDFHKLVAEEITSMQMESTLLTPLLAAGVAAMTVVLVRSITMIGTTLETLERTLMSAFNISQSGSVAESLLRLVDSSKIIPPTLLQVIIGTFLVEVTIIYCILRDGIENGPDPITNGVAIGKGTLTAVIVYSLILFAVILFLGSMINMASFAI